MTKYIDADALKESMNELLKSPWANDKSLAPINMIIKETLGTVKNLCIDDMPAADVEPMMYGEWIKLDAHNGMEQYKCSLCNSMAYVPECMGKPLYNYCPVCGTKMDGGSNEL